MNDQNNFLMAIVLSLAVLLGWQFFVTEPRLEEERARQQAEASISENTSDPPHRPCAMPRKMIWPVRLPRKPKVPRRKWPARQSRRVLPQHRA